MNGAIESMGARRHRTYRIDEQTLQSRSAFGRTSSVSNCFPNARPEVVGDAAERRGGLPSAAVAN
jgi:hypothetical protein